MPKSNKSHKKKSRRRDSSSASSSSEASESTNASSSDGRDRRNRKHHRRDRSRDRSAGRHRDRDRRGAGSSKRKSRDRRSRSRSKSRHAKKDKKSSDKQRGRSRSDSSSSDKSVKLLKRLEGNRLKEALERKRRKEELKAKETPEEKRARRLREKQLKEAKRRERMGWDNEYQHYTNQDNPFGDAHLTSTFVWGKKLEKEGFKNVPSEAVEALNRRKQLENKAELEKVKKRRQERELERLKREEEMVLMQRSKEAAQFEEWERQEDRFHLEQARLRSKIRIQDGRAKPIDLLAQYISNSNLEESIEMQMHEPYTFLNGLSLQDLEDLLVDINVYIELEKGNNSEFWEDMTVIVQDELQKLRKMQLGNEYQVTAGRREGIHQSVARDVTDIFRGKSTGELSQLKTRIEAKISGDSDGVDIGYWESLLSQLKAHMARARLRDKHQEMLRHKLEMLKSEQKEVTEPSSVDVKEEFESMDESSQDKQSDREEPIEDEGQMVLDSCFKVYDEGRYSPKYLQQSDLEPEIILIDPNEDEEKLESQRAQLLEQECDDGIPYTREEMLLDKEARKGMNDEEAEFSVETKLDSQVYLWSDKYRPRKPRYFNRVHTGFEWNKYNQTHYDMDNPPPKIVQGYKFNIFYPDLIDKNTTPQYFLTPCNDNKDFAILRFHSGPPYEDIAFKIVNREWEFSYKRGFRCQFHNNIFQLWFHFKRYRYRR
ncbi:unnamed protein product [Hermetia illucens]|uniref:Splicing factor Cactin n=1 Tax=Hermetia illucens TaxID=343691 RepID=A0A7R8USR9_HERIL|nr:cactin [Hermetia illucens]CAD7086364.1 unnamed protein product [Hermetia illucens]